jgi:hypothetical protein
VQYQVEKEQKDAL